MAGSQRLLWTVGSVVVGLGALLGGTGCEATVETEPVYYARQPVVVTEPAPAVVVEEPGVVWVEGPPVIDYEAYPVYVYGGTNVYFIDDHWYYRDGDRWAYYREEPPALVEYRSRANVVASASYGGNTPRSGAAPQVAPSQGGDFHPTGAIATHQMGEGDVHPGVVSTPSHPQPAPVSASNEGHASSALSSHPSGQASAQASSTAPAAAPAPARRPASRGGSSKSKSRTKR